MAPPVVPDDKAHLKKRINTLTGALFIVNYMVGSGIFVTPHFVLLEAGSIGASLIIWTVCGLIIICGCFANVELGCMMPAAGGAYQYYIHGLHDVIGYLFAWTYLVLISPSSAAAAAISFSNYLTSTWMTCNPPTSSKVVLALCLIWVFVFLNIWSLRAVNVLHRIFGGGKILTLVAIVIMGCVGASYGGWKHLSDAFANTTDDALTLSLSFHSVIFTYSGWNGLNFLAAELKNPERSLPIASALGLGSVVVLYILVNVSYLCVLTPDEMRKYQTTVVAFASALWKPLGVIFSVLVSLSIMGFIASELNATSRITYSAAVSNHMPCIFGLLLESKGAARSQDTSPAISLIASGVLASAYLAAVDVDTLVYMAAFAEATFYVLLAATFFALRWRQPNRPRPFKAFIGFPIIFALVMLVVLVVSLVASPQSCAVSAAVILFGLIFYCLTWYRKPTWFLIPYDHVIILMQKTFGATRGYSETDFDEAD